MKFERKTMKDLLESRGRLVASMREITEHPAGTNGDLSDDQSKKFDDFKLGLASLEKQLERTAFVDEAERRMSGTPITGTGDNRLDDELRNFSLLNAIRAQIPDFQGKFDCGRELELSKELQRRSGRQAQGIMVPTSVFEQRVMTTALPADGPGSNLIATVHRGDMIIDLLRNALVMRRLGARVLSGLVGNVDIPKLLESAVVGWVAENSGIDATDMKFTKVSLSPKHAGAITEMSRNMMQQTSPDIEQLVRSDFAKILAEAVDRVAIQGGGENEPDGILETTGIGDVAMGANGAAPTIDKIIDVINEVEIDNAAGQAFLTNFKVKKTVSKLKNGEGDYYGLDKVFQGYQRAFSNLVPSNLEKGGSGAACSPIIFGDFSDLIIGYWSELDILVNPYESTAYSKGNVQVRGMLTMDLAVRHAESFAAIKDILTT